MQKNQQRLKEQNLNFPSTNEKFLNQILQEYESYNEEYPLSIEQFCQELKNEYDKQLKSDQQYDPSNYFKNSYKHMLNLDQAYNELEEGEVFMEENTAKQQIFSIAKTSPLKIKSKRLPRKQPVISFGEDHQEDFQEVVTQQPEFQLYKELEDNRPLQPLQENEYYSVKQEKIELKSQQQQNQLNNKQNQPQSLKVLPCQRQTYMKKENKRPIQKFSQEEKVKQLKKYIDSNIYNKQIEVIENEEEPNIEEYQLAKKYFKLQLEYLEQLVENNKSERNQLRKKQIDLNYEISLQAYNKEMLQFNQQQKDTEFQELQQKENVKLLKIQRLIKMAEKTHSLQPNKKYLDKIIDLEKQIEAQALENEKTREKLQKKKDKQKYYKDKNLQVKDLQELIEKQKKQIEDLQKSLKEYETNEEVQKLLEQQRKAKEKQIKAEEKKVKENQILEVKVEQNVVERVPLSKLIEEKDLKLSIDDINQRLNLDEFLYDSNQYYKDYRSAKKKKDKLIDKISRSDGKIVKIFKSGKKEVQGMKGFLKEIFPNDYVISHLQNKDIKQELPNGLKIYFFNQSNATQTTFPQGFNVIYFQNKQLEINFIDGSKQILYPDGTKKFINYKGEEEVYFKDGLKHTINFDRIKTIEYPDGNQKVIQLQ